MNVLAQVAQAAEATPALFTYGPMGIITCWLMYRDEKRANQMREVEAKNQLYHYEMLHRIDGLTKALLVDKIDDQSVPPNLRDYARDTVAKIDARGKVAEAIGMR